MLSEALVESNWKNVVTLNADWDNFNMLEFSK